MDSIDSCSISFPSSDLGRCVTVIASLQLSTIKGKSSLCGLPQYRMAWEGSLRWETDGFRCGVFPRTKLVG